MKQILIFLILVIPTFLNAQEYTQSISTIREAIEAHEKAVHIFHDWQRDPCIYCSLCHLLFGNLFWS